jgi:hypothetical protein
VRKNLPARAERNSQWKREILKKDFGRFQGHSQPMIPLPAAEHLETLETERQRNEIIYWS